MMRLVGAHANAIEYARKWNCPVCAASQMPRAPLVTTPTLRPCGFNETVVVDLKYLKDSNGKQWIALSMVDAGTCWHIAVFRHYGCPRQIVVDQGGEFEGYF